MANMQLMGSIRAGASLQGEVVSPEKVQVGGGTSNHAALVNRDLPDQHPIEAITGLCEELDDKQPKGEYLAAEDVPEWARSEEKPTYTAEEVNALPDTTEIPTALADLSEDATHRVVTDEQIRAWNNKPDEIPVKSVNGKTGDVKLSAEDVGALPAGTAIPDELGDLKGDASHRTVTDAQIAAWNAKSEFSGEYSDLKNIPEAPVTSVNGKTGAVKLDAAAVGARADNWMPTPAQVGAHPDTWMPTAAQVGAHPNTWMPTPAQVGADPTGTATAAVSSHNTNKDSHNDIRLLIAELTAKVTNFLDVDDTSRDQLSELLALIDDHAGDLEAITNGKLNKSDVINNLTTNSSDKALSAAQGVVIKALLDGLQSGKLNASELPTAINTALAQAKVSGEFDGADGYTPIKGVDYYTPTDKAEFEAYIATELAKRGQLKPEPAESMEWLKANGETDKLYVLTDKSDAGYGYIFGYFMTEVETGPAYTNVLPLAINADGTPYVGTNGEKGYKTGWRINSSRVEKEATNRCCTGFVPVKYGDTVRLKNIFSPTDGSPNGYVHFYGSDFSTNTGMAYEPNDGTWDGSLFVFTPSQVKSDWPTNPGANVNATENTAYMRISSGVIDETSIITINEEIVEGGGTTTGYAWTNTGLAFVPANYEPRILDLEAQSAKNTADIANLKKGVASSTPIKDWDAPIYDANIPVFQLSAEKAAMTNAAQTPTDIYAKYDALMAKYPHYITKTDLGLCSDGVNHVYRYDFREPDSRHTSGMEWSETKTKAIIVSGIHYEWAGIYGLYYALEEVAENPELYSFRRNSHLIVVPCMNPYATIAGNYSNSVGVRNANGVEIHRNFEVGWVLTEEGTTHYGGAEPLSEVETQYVDTIMKENTDAALFLTCHNFGDTSFNFIWPSVATAYMCNMGYRLIDKLSSAWMKKYDDELVGLEDYRTDDIPEWDNRLGFAHISATPGTETRQATKYGIQSANVEINGRFWVHGTTANPEPSMSSFTMSRGAEVYVNFLLTAFGVYDRKDKKEYAPNLPWSE